ncbi:uncharacterized protein IWZ02DRAFT_483130 [Phyllosticta citriasiana]|uniref:Uncharacterized protein n=1 Tax=Phyllosticta citriasiana TaxID=595635 RepID=A0ABR1KYY7_9PEZI
MGGPEQPYIYEPHRNSVTADSLYGFNPKAVTQASRAAAKAAASKTTASSVREGPLIDFNRHPDSYLIGPYEHSDVEPMSPKTKGRVNWAKWIQFAFRALQLIAAIGLLICVICIKGTSGLEGWIIRVSVAVDAVCILYAVYHLMRRVAGRAPASAASYHFFALFADVALIPFYVFTAMMAKSNLSEAPGAEGRWRTLFKSESATNSIFSATWLTGVTIGALHLISVFLDLYLLIIFRKIANLPPDMNPLDDEMTAEELRRKRMQSSSISEFVAPEKRFSDLTGSTVNLPSPSRASLLEDPPLPDLRSMPFAQTRKDGQFSYSPHTPRSARESRTSLHIYTQPYSAHSSRADLHSRDGSQSPTKSTVPSVFSRDGCDSPPKTVASSVYSTSTGGGKNHSAPCSPPRSSHQTMRKSLQNDNWFVLADREEPHESQPLTRRYSFEAEDDKAIPLQPYRDNVHAGLKFSFNLDSRPLTRPNSSPANAQNSSSPAHLRPSPLRMNPPSPGIKSASPPPPMPFSRTSTLSSDRSSNIGRALTTASTVTRTTADWSTTDWTKQPAGGTSNAKTKKSRYYGDLRSATAAVTGKDSPYYYYSAANTNARNSPASSAPHSAGPSPGATPSPSSAKKTKAAAARYKTATTTPALSLSPATANATNLSPTKARAQKQLGISPERSGYARVEAGPRVVSRSGVDLPFADENGDLGLGRNRHVSGKMAEEGRGGMGAWEGLVQRKVSGLA